MNPHPQELLNFFIKIFLNNSLVDVNYLLKFLMKAIDTLEDPSLLLCLITHKL